MKNKIMTVILGMALSIGLSANLFAQGSVESVENRSASGTTSATVIVPTGSSPFALTDLAWRADQGLTTATIGIRTGASKFPNTSATASSASVIWFTNTGTGVAVGEYVIFLDASTNDYYLRRVAAATTTSVTVDSALGIATTTDDTLWVCNTTSERPVPAIVSATSGLQGIWLPANAPSALTLDGNTTACRISVSGVRTRYK